MEKVKREALAKETSAESFVQTVEQQLMSKANGVQKFAGCIKAPPGLKPQLSNACQTEALKYYKKLVVAATKERAEAEDKTKQISKKETKEQEKTAAALPAEKALEMKFKDIAENIHKKFQSKMGALRGSAGAQYKAQNQEQGQRQWQDQRAEQWKGWRQRQSEQIQRIRQGFYRWTGKGKGKGKAQ